MALVYFSRLSCFFHSISSIALSTATPTGSTFQAKVALHSQDCFFFFKKKQQKKKTQKTNGPIIQNKSFEPAVQKEADDYITSHYIMINTFS